MSTIEVVREPLRVRSEEWLRRVVTGLLANTFFGLWWLDPAVALVIAAAAVQGGVEARRGQICSDCC